MNTEALPAAPSAGEMIGVFRRHWIGCSVCLAICLVIGAFAYKEQKPVFRSSTQILVEGRTASMGTDDPGDPVNQVSLPNPDVDLPTQIQVIQSAKLLGQSLQQAGIIIANPDDLALVPSVKVEQVLQTSVLEVSVDSTDSSVAQQIAQVLPEVYLGYVRQNRQQEVENAIGFLTGKLTGEQTALDKTEADLEEYKKQKALLPVVDEGVERTSKYSTAEAQVHQADASLASARERLRTLEAERAALPATIKSPGTQANSPEIQGQKDKLADLISQRDVLLQQYDEDRPEVKQINIQIADLQRHLAELPKSQDSTSSIRNPEFLSLDSQIADANATLKGAEAEESKLKGYAVEDEKSLKEYSALEPKENQLQRAVDDRKSSIAAIGKAIDVLKVRRNAARDPVTVLTGASPALKVKPQPAMFGGVAVLGGLVLAAGFALMKERIDDKLTSIEQGYEIAGAQPLGHFPALPKASSALVVGEKTTALESYRMIRFNLQFSTLREPVKSFVITSTSQGEGKSVLSSNLAYSMAMDGLRVVLVDSDLRRPTIHKKFNLPEHPGLSEVLLGKATLNECLHKSLDDRLSIVTAGSAVDAPADLLNSPMMKLIHEQLKDQADCVIFDAPATLAGADAQVMGAMADAVLYVAQIGTTRKAAMQAGIDMLRQAEARVLGIIFSDAEGNFSQTPYVMREA